MEGHLFNPEYNKNNNFRIFSKSIGIDLLKVLYRGISIGHKLSIVIGLNFGIGTSLLQKALIFTFTRSFLDHLIFIVVVLEAKLSVKHQQ